MKQIFALCLILVTAVAMFAGCVGSNTPESSEKEPVTYVILDEALAPESYGVGMRNDDIALAAAVQKALDDMSADGTAAAISEKWFGEDLFLHNADWVEGELVPAENDTSLQYILDRKYMIVGLDDSFPPMGFRDEKTNEIVGFDIDLAKEVGKRLGVEVRFQPIDWSAKEMELSQKKIDMIWNGMTITDERVANMAFGKPYIENSQVVVVASDSGIKNLSDLKGKVIGVQRGSSAVDAIDANPELKASFKEQVEYDTNLNAYLDLKAGRVDAVVMDIIVAGYIISTDSA